MLKQNSAFSFSSYSCSSSSSSPCIQYRRCSGVPACNRPQYSSRSYNGANEALHYLGNAITYKLFSYDFFFIPRWFPLPLLLLLP
ncbi:hypothetical protein E2C01_050898 [Portunus trituberculatus]|uniref:Uncharacterized protein n=1 Tax=Portunus trituberculatus TaxID=210409 RepID=A0A5B7G9I3_PORTR|nr:hypothetical protein [Portunus trituberculatus]